MVVRSPQPNEGTEEALLYQEMMALMLEAKRRFVS